MTPKFRTIVFAMAATAISGSLVLAQTTSGTSQFVDSVNQLQTSPDWSDVPADGRSPNIVALQVLLDRAGYSVGVIDGYEGENLQKALAAFAENNGIDGSGDVSQAVWNALAQNDMKPFLKRYEITRDDLKGPFQDAIPEDYAKMAELDRLGFTSPQEMLAERFHMDIDLLTAINQGKTFSEPGSVIWVADTGSAIDDVEIKRIIVDASAGKVSALDKDNKLVAHYPATVGSRENPSPSGTHEVTAVAIEPTYTYNPSVNFQQGDNDEKLSLPPGPNGPVGSVWIDLSEPTYGLHGTPEPALVDKAASHGCVRLTNWDAHELAQIVSVGAKVEFKRN